MRTVTLRLPPKTLGEIKRYVKAGWFVSDDEAIRAAVFEFVRRNRLEVVDRFMREDIAWALGRKNRAA